MADPAPASLSGRILAGVLSAVAAVWLATTAYSYWDARHEVNELLDAHLAQSASLIVAQLGNDLEEIELEHAPALDRSNRRVAFQVWESGRTLRLHSANAPSTRLSSSEEGFSDAGIDGKAWRVFSAWDAKHRYLVQVGERAGKRDEIAAGVAVNLLVPLLVALPLLGLFAWLTVRRALAPLSALGADVSARRPDNLSPLAAADAPAEVAPLVASLNGLFARVAASMENERRFTADAAHELRTPLAALRAQAQVAQGATDGKARAQALDAVIAGCDRLARLIEQLLTLARLDPGAPAGAMREMDLRQLALERLADLAPAALARGVELELQPGAPVTVEGYPELIAILLRNLLDNAVRYSRPGGCVRVDVAAAPVPSITVLDEGPGIPAAELGRVGQRFYRVLGNESSGSGLGLSIVRRIAELHGGSLRLGDGPGGKGLLAAVAFRAPARHLR